jgi:hypothetical protein
MLNNVLEVLEEEQVFAQLGRTKSIQLVQRIVHMSFGYDCNRGEILEGIGARLGICYGCAKVTQELTDGLCRECRVDRDMDE